MRPSGGNSILFSYVYYHGLFIILPVASYGPPHARKAHSTSRRSDRPYSCCRVLSWSCDLRFGFADDFDMQLRASLFSLVKDMRRVKVFL